MKERAVSVSCSGYGWGELCLFPAERKNVRDYFGYMVEEVDESEISYLGVSDEFRI